MNLSEQIKQKFLYKPTKEQENLLKLLTNFLLSPQKDEVFLLKGYAGTGKTSLVSALVKTLDDLKQKCILLAPTGRAAKVFSHYAGHPAYTIHRRIYRQRSFSNELDNFTMNVNLHQHTLFIVDEASMISNEGLSGNLFGSGRLLADVLKGYGLSVTEQVLTQVVRQKLDSGILYNATELRIQMGGDCFGMMPRIRTEGFPDVRRITGADLIETINTCYDQAGMDETIIICRSNKRANLYNNGIRNTILYREDELNTGDILMVAKNNYFWGTDVKELDFIANGDIAEVRRVRRIHEMYGFRFADVLLSFPDYGDIELETKVLLDTLHSDSPALTKEESDRLFYAVLEDYQDIPTKRERMKKMKADPWYNALQVKYAYAVTCHKAQGGQWKRVFIDQGYIAEDMLTPEFQIRK